MLNVLFDARFITEKPTGVGRVAEMLLRAMLSASSDINLHVLYREPFNKELIGNHPILVKTAFDSHPAGDWFRNVTLRKIIRNRDIDVYFSPAFYSIQFGKNIPQIVLIHDMAVYDEPESANWTFRLYLRQVIRSALKNATYVTTPSAFIRDRITSAFSGVEDKIHVISHGVDASFSYFNDSKANQLLKYYCLPPRFILCVATVEPRKNLLKLMDAYAIYVGRAHEPLHLVIVGDRGYRSEEVFNRAERPDVATHVRFLGYVPDADLTLLYGMANCFVYPSLYEGFGMPVLEAMAAGCPVITSNTASLPEVSANAALLVDPEDILEIWEALSNVTENAALRSRLGAAGKKRIKELTWESSAERYFELFRKLRSEKE